MKSLSLDKNMNVLKHVFINSLFAELEFLCMAHLLCTRSVFLKLFYSIAPFSLSTRRFCPQADKTNTR